MTTHGFVLTVASALLTALANLLMRAGIRRLGTFRLSADVLFHQILQLAMQPLFVSGFISYGLAAVIWFRVLSAEDLSTGYPILVGLTFVCVSLGAVIVFREAVPWTKVLGMVLILLGIFIISRA